MLHQSCKSGRQHVEKVSIYVVPHADDWQLFMQPNAYKDIVSATCKTVFIVTTAGDAGLGEIYWRAREEGCKSSIRFCLAPIEKVMEHQDDSTINGRLIPHCSINSLHLYFLRLPDGNLDGSGFASSNFDTLLKLKQQTINGITCIDRSCTYNDWPDVVTTIQSIIESEIQGMANVVINYLNPDKLVNPEDHADHLITGQAIQSVSNIKNFRQVLYNGYGIRNKKADLPLQEMFWKTGMFAAYEQTVFRLSGYSTIAEDQDLYVNWCSRSSDCVCIASNPDSAESC